MAGGHVQYHEPGAVELLVLSSFVYLLNLARWVTDRLVYAGLLGEIAVGIIYGPPLADILPHDWLQCILVLGYLGLVIIVFEGGLEFEASLFLKNAALSLAVALTGILLPIALSFALFGAGFGYPMLQAFAAGASLSSTSLGTTFFVLQATATRDPSKSLIKTRIGTVLVAAALIDDVIGLMLLSVLSSLGDSGSSLPLGWKIVQPILAAAVMAGVFPCAAILLRRFVSTRPARRGVALFLIVAVLSGLVSVAYWAGTSVLFGAFLAGVCLSLLPPLGARHAYDVYVKSVQDYLLAPLFFASIGYSIPFLDLFTGRRIWRGLVYTILMVAAKVLAGVWPLIISRRNWRASWVPALFVGSALVARGEIGVLIATVANSDGVLNQDAYLEAIWAILLCTLLGPPVVGWIVRKWEREILEGPWGIGEKVEDVELSIPEGPQEAGSPEA
ncbi:Sodium/hydrogen exchanger [Auricularia subglabra TFB-10046 SS5]|nr:Sodium/hydrogen exchanger [Auricularia subglabra TFB-10046 SS5]